MRAAVSLALLTLNSSAILTFERQLPRLILRQPSLSGNINTVVLGLFEKWLKMIESVKRSDIKVRRTSPDWKWVVCHVIYILIKF